MTKETTLPSHGIDPVRRMEAALDMRRGLLDERHETALRLFNGFYEGYPALVVDVYAHTLVFFDHAPPAEAGEDLVGSALEMYRSHLPWLRTGLLKARAGSRAEARAGMLLFGEKPDRRIRELGVHYSIDLTLHGDASFYLDTRNLRDWARRNLGGLTVLNAFAYTGSLGAAARAGGARRVLQVDRNRSLLNVAKASFALNGFPVRHADFMAEDFFRAASRFRRRRETFDCVFLDPPFFAASSRGTVDLVHSSRRLIDKVRPLVREGGRLVAVNNALFVGGAQYLRTLEEICAEGEFSLEELIPVPEDITGWPETVVRRPPADPAPFNHPTKIAVLRAGNRIC